MTNRAVAALLFLMLGLCACTYRLPRKPSEPELPPEMREQAWLLHLRQTVQLTTFRIEGRMAIRTSQEAGTVGLLWEQHNAAFQVITRGPLGQTLGRLAGDEQGAEMTLAGRQPMRSDSTEKLLYRLTGTRLPFRCLTFWLRGVPDSGQPFEYTLTGAGRLATLHQNGWAIRYGNYRQVGDQWLPKRMRAEREGAVMVLSVHHWRLSAPTLVSADEQQ